MFKLKAKQGAQWMTIGVASVFTDGNGNPGLTCEIVAPLGADWNGRFIAVSDEAELAAPKKFVASASGVHKEIPKAEVVATYGDPMTNPATAEEYEAGWRYCPRRKGGHVWNIYSQASLLLPDPKKRPEEYPDSKCRWHTPVHREVEKPIR